MKAEPPPLDIVVQRCVPAAGIPAANSLRRFARAALADRGGELTLRLVDAVESQALNHRFRGKDRPTNVLSFPYDGPGLLGDLVLCAEVVAEEARQQGKRPQHHWAHLVVHGCLHLQGLDHEAAAEADAMEAREIAILRELGIDNPYA
ncbi:rRNA maturation RNase YbeY [Flagellatimonas centrodinii]|uniref:rRNA maturation RNase YbeY n=1 Tax=Flagellatimonas centrodinii TaxID=2806210 RepID=UPI001FED86CF|nr:rRNA maturation RNase YbeY [Flagellatimonas centrodinii]ULQ45318.1 rRNA maturation RNase YbeY [Flagellatimonas centrodinii]